MDIFKYAEGSAIELLGYWLSLVLINTFIRGFHEDVGDMLIKSAINAVWRGHKNRYEIVDRIKIQNYLDMLRCWAKTNNVVCNEDKCKLFFFLAQK